MARDATSSGDPVAAENYFQHAEHYYRVLSANGGGGFQGNQPRFRGPGQQHHGGNGGRDQQRGEGGHHGGPNGPNAPQQHGPNGGNAGPAQNRMAPEPEGPDEIESADPTGTPNS